MKHVVSYSGGAASWATAKCVAAEFGTTHLVLLFADTLIEDNDLYRFLVEGAADVFGVPAPTDLLIACRNLPPIGDLLARKAALAQVRTAAKGLLPGLVWILDGRTPWEVFFDERLMGNSRMDPCSRVLKRELLDSWVKGNCNPESTTQYVGIDWTEEHRFTRLRDRKAIQGWTIKAPLVDSKVSKSDIFEDLAERGIPIPRLYKAGFPHNNCGGFCVKAGQGHFALLLKNQPETYAYHEAQERAFREFIGKDVSIMKDRRGGGHRPLPMAEFRARVQAQDYDKFEFGGCGCAVDEPEAA